MKYNIFGIHRTWAYVPGTEYETKDIKVPFYKKIIRHLFCDKYTFVMRGKNMAQGKGEISEKTYTPLDMKSWFSYNNSIKTDVSVWVC